MSMSLRVELVGGSPVVEDVSFAVRPGEILGIVGESGSGKTTTALALLGIRAAGGAGRERRRSPCVTRSCSRSRSATLRRTRGQARLLHRAGSRLRPQPIAPRRRPDRRDAPRPHRARRWGARGGRRAGARQSAQRPGLSTALRAPALRRTATAARHRHRDRLLAARGRHGRADDRSRRRHPGADPHRDRSPAPRVAPRDRLREPRHPGRRLDRRPDRRDVRGPRDRGGSDGHDPGASAPPVHPRPRRVRPRPHGAAALAGDSRRRGRRRRTAGGMLLRTALHPARRPLRDRDARARGDRSLPSRALLRMAADTGRSSPTPPHLASTRATGVPLLHVESLRAVYRARDGDVVAADDVSFTVAPGECVAIVGESGSGKTTIARCVAGLHRPAAGRILLDGALLAAEAKQRDRTAPPAHPDRLPEPVRLAQPPSQGAGLRRPARPRAPGPLGRAGRRRGRRAARARAAPRAARGTAIRGELSGGERQRVAIARALAAKPDLADLRRDHVGTRRLGAGRRARPARRASGPSSTSRCSSSPTISASSRACPIECSSSSAA